MQNEPSNKFLVCADLLEWRLGTYNIYGQTVIRNYIRGLRSPDPIEWGKANAEQAHAIAFVLGITDNVQTSQL
jgi:hypothetical protein